MSVFWVVVGLGACGAAYLLYRFVVIECERKRWLREQGWEPYDHDKFWYRLK